MKQFYLSILFISFTVFLSAQTNPTGSSAETGVTAGNLAVTLSGGASYTIPIAVPPGINGVVPQISLSYNSQNGPGLAGYGWNVSGISKITRIPTTKFHDGKIDPVDYVNDRFALDGERLLVKKGTGGVYGANGTQYETENFSNVKITSYINPTYLYSGPVYFLVEYPDGSKAHYGHQNGGGTFLEWGITYWENAQGINIHYENYGEKIHKITYGSRGLATPINEIKFKYQPRSRKENFYIGGVNEIKYDKLSEIEIKSNNIGFRNYSLEYTQSSQNYDQLSKVTEKNGDKSKSYNPTVFQYDNTESTINYIDNPNTLDVNNVSSLNANTITGDFDGDGNMDFILYPTTGSNARNKSWLFTGINPNGNAKTTINQGLLLNTGPFDEIFPVSFLTWNNKYWFSKGWTVLKTDATTNISTFTTYATDGSSLVYSQGSKQHTFPKITHSFTACNNAPVTVEEVIPKNYLNGDFNGDGLTDLIIIEKPFSYTTKVNCSVKVIETQTFPGGKSYFVNLDSRINSNFVNPAGILPITPNSKCYIADYNGDGKSDIFIFDTGVLKVYTLIENNTLVEISKTINSNIRVDVTIVIGDYNGDGKADFIIPSPETPNWWYRFPSKGGADEKGNGYTIESLPNYAPFNANNPNSSYNYFATDYDNDGKSDLTIVKNTVKTQYFFNPLKVIKKGTIQVSTYTETALNTFIKKTAITSEQENIDIYALPIYLPSTDSKQPRLEIAFINQNKLHFFYSPKDSSKDGLLKSITAGNGVKESITYQPLDEIYENDYYPIYKSSQGTETYPYFDIVSSPDFQIVSKIEKKSGNVSKKQLYGYYGAVTHLNGLGFMGFRSIMKTNWHDSNTPIMSSVSNRNIKLRGATTESYVLPYLTYPYDGFSPSSFTSKTTLSYTPSTAEAALQENKVFKLQNTGSVQENRLENTSVTTTNTFDSDNNIKTITSVTQGSGDTQTAITSIDYQDVITSPLYILGRPYQKTQSVSVTGAPTMSNTEVYTYNSNQLLSDIEKSATGTATIKEHNDYDSFGNVTKKTIIAPFPLQPRSTQYEYDASGRFVTKITDNDLLASTFGYDLNNGLLKKETDSNGRSTSYTYDSWFKPLTVKDDQLNLTTSTSYTKSHDNHSGSRTTIITNAPDGPVSFQIFDDLGRKIKSGVTDINGDYSYMDFEYDLYDRNYKTSEPYSESDPIQWNETKFDLYGRPTETKLFNQRTTTASYSGLVSTITDGLKTKTITKNAVGNVISTDETLGGTINYSYFANGNLKQTRYNGISINMEQNGWGQKTALIDPSAGTFGYKHNDFGELEEETSQNGNVKTTIARDASGRPSKKTMTGPGTNSETTYTYDAAKLPLTISYKDLNDPSGANDISTSIVYDDTFKRPTSITEQKTGVYKFTRTFNYDNLGRVITETKTAEAGGKSSTVVTKNVYKNGALYQILDINNKTLWQVNTVNAKGQLLESITGNGIKMTNTYDTNGYISKIQHDKTTNPTGNIITLTTKFDKNTDNLDSRINSAFGNYTEDFDYDELGRLKEFKNKYGVQETQTYNASGKITGNNLGTYDYDPVKKYQNTSITLNPEALDYYTARGNIFSDNMESETGWFNYYGGSTVTFDKTTAAHSGSTSLKISNDDTYEKITHTDKWIDVDNTADTEYTYSAWVYGDSPVAEVFLFMKTSQETGYYSVVDHKTIAATNQWTKVEKTFLVPASIKKLSIRLDNDGIGNVWFDDVQIRKTNNNPKLDITYNAFKSPIQIEETGVEKISFTYNADDQRSTMYYGGLEDKELRPLRKHYAADGSMEIKQNTTTGAIEFVTYIAGDGYSAPIAVKSDGVNPANYLYLHRDYQGTILAITNDAGAVVEKRLFDAWGDLIKVQDGAGNTLNGLTVLDRGYTGHEHLQSVGLINMNARLYDPLLHRFLQVDNYIQDPANTQNYNQYGYVLNNPLLYTDPSGNTYGNDKDCVNCWHEINNQIGGGAFKSIANLFKDGKNAEWFKKNAGEIGRFAGRNLQEAANYVGRNIESLGRDIGKFLGIGGGDGPPPNLSSYVNLNTQTGSGQYYGGDGSGNFMDYLSRFVYETDQYNPIALLWDGIKGNITGTDRYNNELSGFEANMKIVSAVPMTKVASIATNSGIKGISMMSSRALTNGQLVESAAIRAERAIGGVGGVAGTAKHQYASTLLNRYQRIYGNRGLETGLSFNNNLRLGAGNRGFLDVIDHTNGVIYDFKFGKAFMSRAQYNKYFNNFGLPIYIIRP
ncbi:RHS repeat-associated core domain-containing protein [Flavobacterium pectinovorum]|uniref:RHS repeat-associated core domain-containing protein n=1 Tax=Flavobacterium pectinovorum TaxID=29533 RepID=UPI001FABE655|nr:RHS repeat-associated core domain-containing protein [Flavobacterium pectinovorum]MCI9843341.1 VCBS repeat-containing protein [Flavobacterium pectinovorum]